MDADVVEGVRELLPLMSGCVLGSTPDAFLRDVYLDHRHQGLDRLPHPTMATWNITNRCNLHCHFCSAAATSDGRRVSEDRALPIARALVDNGLRKVAILGGEPTLCIELLDSIELLVRSNVFVDMASNGAGIDDAFCARVAELPTTMLRLMISIDSHDEITNDRMRGRGAYACAVAAARRLRSRGVAFAVGMTVTQRNRHHIADTFRFAEDLGASLFGISFVLPMGRGRRLRAVPLTPEVVKQVRWVLHHQERTRCSRVQLGADAMRYYHAVLGVGTTSAADQETASAIKCQAGKYRILVDADGTVYPCDMLVHPELRMGNVLTDTMASIWNSGTALWAGSLTRSTKRGCSTCPITWCNTGCFGMTYQAHKDTGASTPPCEVGAEGIARVPGL